MQDTKKTKLIGQATQEQIHAWKKEYKDVFEYRVDGRVCYLRTPDRKILAYAQTVSNGNEMSFNETLLENCFIGGDSSIKSEDKYFLGISGKLSDLIEIKAGELGKL